MNAEQRAALRKLAEDATPGPWNLREIELYEGGGFCHEVQAAFEDSICGNQTYHPPEVSFENQSFIAAANPQAISELLDYIDQLEEKIDDLVMSLDAAIGEAK